MLKVLGRATSSNVQKVTWTLEELGVPYDREDIGGAFGGLDTPEYIAMNPNKVIPTVIDGDLVLWESNAIVRYLGAKHDNGGLWPSDPGQRALADRWMDWQLSVLLTPWIRVFFGVYRTPAQYQDADRNAAAIKELGETYAILDQHLEGRAFVAGDHLTMADIPVGMSLWRYYQLDITRPSMPNIERWYATLQERPAYRATVMSDFSSLKDTLIPGQGH
ncbi:MAG: glutathione S-transferase family protein [Alphaproteobacteria bacterium]|jgi:glutathione S-transferase|nr:glutathione S-transferase family protein [Rhodospirillaceae bacterium]MBT6511197.1 glutathione S-transferase family protein [Rhodospirillaceae bacterium]MBT7647503.1 glutathione S-transferase family protein [Rhodospirillaceae bacterium]MDG2480617.1 glutathione S-transferase family protein [Alphaproteobacteria bacterium]